MRSKEEILKDVKICYLGDCNNCSKNNSDRGCRSLMSEVIKLIEVEHNAGMEEAWKMVKKIYDTDARTCEDIFGVTGAFWDVIRDFSPQEAKAKIEAWEESKIRVGDVVIIDHCGIMNTYAVVTLASVDSVCVLHKNGTTATIKRSALTKTGKHIDLDGLLKQIGE